jgi:sirohydrochlorin cobaltochelatase
MKAAILLISFGTSYEQARQNSLNKIGGDLEKLGLPVYQAYTSDMIIRKVAAQEILIDTVEEALNRALEEGIRCLYAVPTHMISGIEYKKMLSVLEQYQNRFEQIHIADTVLAEEEYCNRMVKVLDKILSFSPDREYILMGHGTEDAANIRYVQMNEAFIRSGFNNVRIVLVEAKPDLEDAIQQLHQKNYKGEVVLHPFMVVAGDHAQNDMAGEKDSYRTRLLEEGFTVLTVVKGLGEYREFRNIYVEKVRRMM